MAYAHKNSKGKTYYLHTKKVDLKGSGKTQVIYWFAGAVGPNGLEEVPAGYMVIESKRTGLPLLKKK